VTAGYLKMLYHFQRLFNVECYDKMIAFHKLERILEEKVVDYFKVTSTYSSAWSEENHGNLSQDSRYQARDSNRAPLESKPKALLLKITCCEKTWKTTNNFTVSPNKDQKCIQNFGR
jgi:hypothetical protein